MSHVQSIQILESTSQDFSVVFKSPNFNNFRLVINADASGAVNFCDCTGSELFRYVLKTCCHSGILYTMEVMSQGL